MYANARKNKKITVSLFQIGLVVIAVVTFYVLPIYLLSTPQSTTNNQQVYTAQALQQRNVAEKTGNVLGIYTNIDELTPANQSKLLLAAGLMFMALGLILISLTLLYQNKRTHINAKVTK